MARERYSFGRVRLNRSFFDIVINPTSPHSTLQFRHEITVRTLCGAVIAAFCYWPIIMYTFMREAGVIDDIIFTIGYIAMIAMIMEPTRTHLTGYRLLKPMWQYFTGENRYVSTRPQAPMKLVDNLLGIDKLVKGNGKTANSAYIKFTNGDIGEILELSGNASMLTFDSSLDQIIDAADTFYRNVKPTISMTLDSQSAAQRVTDQLHWKHWQMEHMATQDPGARKLLYYNYKIIKDFVGRDFKAWHQYLIVRAMGNDPSLSMQNFNAWIANTVKRSGLFINEYRHLNYKDEKRFIKQLYGDDVSPEARAKLTKGNQ